MTHPSDRWRLRPEATTTTTVPTTESVAAQLGAPRVHRLSREETAAWNDADPENREEARTAIRDAVREQGGGELHDTKGKRRRDAVPDGANEADPR